MYLTRYHVTPIELCEFYGFFVFEFITAQYCMVFLIATNALCLIKYRMRFYLGKRDWKFLVISFGGPFVICVIAAGLDQMGPVGSFCGISGRIANLFFSVVPQLFVLVACSILYAVTWYHISKETKTIQASLGQATQSVQSSRLAARNMSLFVAVFFIQYAPSGISSIVMMRGDINPIAVPVVLAFTNIGGVLNCIVYLVVRKKGSKVNPTQNSSNNKEATGKHSSKTDMDTSDNKPMAVI
ncbi:hypothetical protein FSP39_004474 [Pinctada imbricata]|uniref:G-protein coupled receptors family 1 profile domain-containing protein n=1 Tax=Pinctada imbricata TaxID=66713 RepID=A0AA88YTI5_PINIB|nr:hypothetical protein FSP39_004474 [Pinctada imbricata]